MDNQPPNQRPERSGRYHPYSRRTQNTNQNQRSDGQPGPSNSQNPSNEGPPTLRPPPQAGRRYLGRPPSPPIENHGFTREYRQGESGYRVIPHNQNVVRTSTRGALRRLMTQIENGFGTPVYRPTTREDDMLASREFEPRPREYRSSMNVPASRGFETGPPTREYEWTANTHASRGFERGPPAKAHGVRSTSPRTEKAYSRAEREALLRASTSVVPQTESQRQQARNERYRAMRESTLRQVTTPAVSTIPQHDPRVIEGDDDPRLAYDDHPRRVGEGTMHWQARCLKARQLLGIKTKPLLPRAEDVVTRNKERPADARRAYVNMSENNHANLINELGNLYDKEYTTAWRAAKKARQEANREIERQLLERTRAWQARNGFDREPTPDPAEDSDDGLYHYEFEQTARDAGRVRCLTCNRFKKTCSLEENPRKACNFCREGGHKCFRMMSGVRYRGAPYAAGEPMADRGEDPGRIRPMGKYMWKEKTLKKNGVEVVAPERRDDDDEDEETMWSKPSQKKKEPKERAKTRGPYDTPRARERAAAMGSSSPVPPPRQFRDRKTRQSTVDEESEDDEYRQYRDRREPASTRRGRRSRSPETNRYGLRTTAEDFGNRLQYQEDEGNDADCVEERHRARSPSPRRIATPPPPPIPVEFPDFDINEFIDPNLANFQQDQGYPSSQLQADEELAAQALAQLSEQSQTPLVFEPPREPDEQVSSYAPARTLQPGTEQDQPYTFLTALNQLQAQSAPPGNGWNGQYELPQRPEQEAINAASVYGLNDNSAPESTSRVSNPISSLHPLNAEHLTEDMPVLNAAGVPTIPTNPQNNADPLAQLTTANYHGFNQMQFLVGNERWSPEEVLPNYRLLAPPQPGDIKEAPNDSYKCGEGLLFFDKVEGKVSQDDAEQPCMGLPSKDCDTFAHTTRFSTCVYCKTGAQDGASLEHFFTFSQRNRSFLCTSCAGSLRENSQWTDTCLCVNTMQEGYSQNSSRVTIQPK